MSNQSDIRRAIMAVLDSSRESIESLIDTFQATGGVHRQIRGELPRDAYATVKAALAADPSYEYEDALADIATEFLDKPKAGRDTRRQRAKRALDKLIRDGHLFCTGGTLALLPP